MKKLILILIVFTSLILTGCTDYTNFNAEKLGDSCIISSRSQIGLNSPDELSVAIYCIDGVQYISVEGVGISPYINPEALNNYFENGYRSCSCKEGKE
jgi:hypothetical protein